MNFATVLNILGRLLFVYAGVMLVPLCVAIAYEGVQSEAHEPLAFLVGALATATVGAALRFWLFRKADTRRFGHREGFAIVGIGWVTFAMLGAIPWCLLGGTGPDGQPLALGYLDAVFETMSGLTTTGATILTNIEQYGHGILFWRAMTHWLGGMGIVVLVVAILPSLGAGGYQLLRAEVPGPTADKIAPRIAQTAKILWAVYILLTLLQIVLLWAPSWFIDTGVGVTVAADGTAEGHYDRPYMDLYEATCHTFATLATGGFSTRNGSMADFAPYYQYVVIVFMVLAGTNFLLHWHLLMGRPKYMVRSSEWRAYIAIIVFATLVVFAGLSMLPVHDTQMHGDDRMAASTDPVDDEFTANPEKYATTEARLRHSLFQVVAIVTTTGFCTADFDRWPDFCRFMLVGLMFLGGCAGSTSGGLKLIRVMVVVKHAVREVRQLIRPHAVVHVKVGGERVSDKVVSAIIGTFTLYLLLGVAGMAVFTMLPGFDLTTAFTTSVSCIGNIGPGLGGVGAIQNYAWIPDFGKVVCCVLMLLGRLEIFTIFILFVPAFYKR